MIMLRFRMVYILAALMVAISIGASSRAQDSSNTEREPTASRQCSQEDPSMICSAELNGLRPTFWERFGRGLQYQFQRAEQPRSILVGSTAIQNPEHYLNQHSLSFQFGELFLSSSDRTSIVKQIFQDRLTNSPSLAAMPVKLEWCSNKPTITCLAGGSIWQRALSGLSVTFSLSERQRVQQGVLLPAQLPFQLHYGISGEIDFDPKSLFVTPVDWKNSFDAVQKMPGIQVDPQHCIQANGIDPITNAPLQVESERQACIETLSAPTLKGSAKQGVLDQLLEVFVPTFQFKRVSQFDFIKNTGFLIASPFPGLAPAPFPESGLNTYTVTWDFKKWITTTASKLAADSAFRAYKLPPSQLEPKSQDSGKVCITISANSRNYINVLATSSAVSCQKLAQTIQASQYALACSFGNNVQGGASEDSTSEPVQSMEPIANSCGWTIP